MKITHPKQYDYCMREENGLGLAKVLRFYRGEVLRKLVKIKNES